jgi:hypothetical protein
MIIRVKAYASRDVFHDAVRNAIEKDGWTITDDPLILKLGRDQAFVDLGAEKLLTAQKGARKIAVEVKSFIGASEIHDLRDALGQYMLYQTMLEELQPDRKLYLAVSEEIFNQVFTREIGALLIERRNLSMIVFDDEAEVIIRWII